jgi:hypothetical protein
MGFLAYRFSEYSSAAVASFMALSGSYPLHALDLFFSSAHPMSYRL